MVLHMERADGSNQNMEDREAQQDPDPRYLKNGRDEKRGKEEKEDVTEGREKKRGRNHDREAQKELSRLARLFSRKRSDGFEVSPEGAQQAEQHVNQTTANGNRTFAGTRSASITRRFQTRISDGR